MKIKRYLLGIVVVLLVVGVATFCGEDATEKIHLRLNLQEGESYSLRMITDQDISQTIQGQQQETKQTMGLGYTFDVNQVNSDGSALTRVTYDWVLFEQDGPLGKTKYDSATPPDTVPPAAAGYAALVGQGFTMEISPAGRVQDLQGVDDMITHMLEELDLPEGATMDSIEQSFRDQFGDQALQENMESLMAIYPEGPIGIGDSWSKTVATSVGLPMILENRWTLTAREDGVATVDVYSTIKSNPEAAPLEIAPVKMSFDISGVQQGTMSLDEGTGWTISAHVTQTLAGEIEMEMGERMSWPISIKSTTRLESLEE